LFEEGSFEIDGLTKVNFVSKAGVVKMCVRTVKVGLVMAVDEVTDSAAEETEADASEAALLTSSAAFARETAAAIRTAEAIPWKRIADGGSLSNSGTVVGKENKAMTEWMKSNCRLLGGSDDYVGRGLEFLDTLQQKVSKHRPYQLHL